MTNEIKPEFRCSIAAGHIKRALNLVSKEETRYYLNGVFVEPCPAGGAYVVATDGTALVCLRDSGATITGSAILHPDPAFAAALEPDGYEPAPRRVFANRECLLIARAETGEAEEVFALPNKLVAAAQFVDPIIDGPFPNWRKVMPPAKAGGHIPPFDTRILARMAAALCSDRPLLRLIPTGDDNRCPVWAFGDLTDGAGIAMGLASDAKQIGDTPPQWLGDLHPLTPRAPEPA